MKWQHMLVVASLALLSAMFVNSDAKIALCGVAILFTMGALRLLLFWSLPKSWKPRLRIVRGRRP